MSGALPPLVEPGPELTSAQRARYARHLSLPQIGELGQRRLLAARVLVIGAGGLGTPVIHYLAAAGVGHITILDGDVVEESNLQRQAIHSEDAAAAGDFKAASAVRAAGRINSGIDVRGVTGYLNPDNALEFFAGHDLVIDGSDNFATRYLSGDASEITATPLVWATISQFSGQLSVFYPGRGPGLRDLYPDPPAPDSVPTCAEGGVLGALPGMVGSAMAIEAVKLLTGCGRPAVGQLVLFDALEMTSRSLSFGPDPQREPVTELGPQILQACRLQGPVDGGGAPEITVTELRSLLAADADGPEVPPQGRTSQPPVLVDVREASELQEIPPIPGARHVPVGRVLERGWEAITEGIAGGIAGEIAGSTTEVATGTATGVSGATTGTTTGTTTTATDAGDAEGGSAPLATDPAGATYVIYCHSGVRSARAAAALVRSDPTADVSTLGGGIVAWTDSGGVSP